MELGPDQGAIEMLIVIRRPTRCPNEDMVR